MEDAERKISAVKALGQIEGIKDDIERIDRALESVPLWRPSSALRRQCREISGMIDDLRERFESKLVVTLIGPSGSGKSTLLNALSGADDLSESGTSRPTTRNLVVLSAAKSDAEQLRREIGGENVRVSTRRAPASLENVMLIDTPDTDSTEQEKHIPMVKRAIALSDVLICLFDSENPKRRDYVDFLKPYVKLFKGEALLAVLNKCDRLDERELKENILPDFESYLKKAWDGTSPYLFCISARSHLQAPGWNPQASPRHEFDQYPELKTVVFETFNQAAFVVDRRLENAKTLKAYLLDEIRKEADRDAEALARAREQIAEVERKALKEAVMAVKTDDSSHMFGVNVLLYQKLSQRWFGPVGWVIALWARILIFGAGMTAIFRFGNPLRQIAGVATSLMHFKNSRAAVAEAGSGKRAEKSLRQYRMTILKEWPEAAEEMIRGRFDTSVRNKTADEKDHEEMTETLSGLWSDSLNEAVSKAARGFSGFFLQLFFNLPALFMLGHAGYLTANLYWQGKYQTSDFFLHAFLTLLVILFMSFFILQLLIRVFASADRIAKFAFAIMKSQAENYPTATSHPAARQIDEVLQLGSRSPRP